MRDQIIALLSIVPGGSAETIADDLSALGGAPVAQDIVQRTLIEMDDAGDVLMRGGWYRLSEAAKKTAGRQQCLNPPVSRETVQEDTTATPMTSAWVS